MRSRGFPHQSHALFYTALLYLCGFGPHVSYLTSPMQQIIIHVGFLLLYTVYWSNVSGPMGVIFTVLRDMRGEKQRRIRVRMQRRVNPQPYSLVLKNKDHSKKLKDSRKEADKLDYNPGARQGVTRSHRSKLDSRFLTRPINAPLAWLVLLFIFPNMPFEWGLLLPSPVER